MYIAKAKRKLVLKYWGFPQSPKVAFGQCLVTTQTKLFSDVHKRHVNLLLYFV